MNYRGWRLSGSGYVFRGPEPKAPIEDSIVCIGSAATFGRFATHSYAHLLGERLKVPVINLGIGGARPCTFMNNSAIVDVLRRCRTVIVEMMSARSYRSEIFTPMNTHSGLGVSHLAVDAMAGTPSFNQKCYLSTKSIAPR